MRGISVFTLAVLAVMVFSSAPEAQGCADRVAGLDEELSGMLPDDGPGASVIVTCDGETVFEGYYGLADIEAGVKLGPSHVIGIASMTKQFTAMAVLVLASEGRLDLDDDIGEHLPGLGLGGRGITVRRLLSHTSGLPELTQNEAFMTGIDAPRTIGQIIELGLRGEPRSAPGEKYIYCNTGFTIAAALIEKLSGTRYADFLFERLFEPLGMNSTYVCERDYDACGAAPRFLPDSTGYARARKMHFSNLAGGGNVISNSRDVAVWCEALLTGVGLPDGYEELWKRTPLSSGELIDYGLGMGISEYEGRTFYYHPGMGDGMNSIDLVFPGGKVTINVIRNVSGPKHPAREIALMIAERLFE